MSSAAPGELVKRLGGRYASASLGIDLASLGPDERFKSFLAALLYGARISDFESALVREGLRLRRAVD